MILSKRSGPLRLPLVLSGAFMISLAGCNKPVSPGVAATVNGRPIAYSALDRAMAAQFSNSSNSPTKTGSDQTIGVRLEALRTLIDNEIFFQRAEKEGLL